MTAKRGVKSEDLYELKSVVDPQFAPDGNSFVYVQTVIDKETKEYSSHIYFNTIESGHEPVQWTFGEGRNHSPKWSPDGSSLAFVSNRSGKNQIYVLSIHGGEARQVTDSKNGTGSPVWSPDSGRIAFTVSLREGEVLAEGGSEEKKNEQLEPLEVTQMKYKSDSEGFWKGTYKQIGIVDIHSGEIKLLTKGPHSHQLFSWSPDGKYLAAGADLDENRDLSFKQDVFLLEIDTQELTPLTSGTGYFGQAEWSSDGRYIGIIGHEQEFMNATHPKIWLYDCAAKELSCVTKDWDVPVGDFTVADFQQGAAGPGLIWSDDNKGFYFTASAEGSTNIFYGDLTGQIRSVFPKEQHVYGLTVHAKTGQAIAAISNPVNMGELFLLSLADGETRQLTNANGKFLEGIELSSPESFEFEGANGTKVQGWILKPAGFEEGKKYPLILEIHGGPHAMYGNTYMNEFQILAGQGYAVLYVNPRGSHGYGQKFVDAVRGDYGGGDYQDLMLAVDYALKSYEFIDETRLGVTGGSYGGFMTNWIVGHTDRFKAAVTQRSISNWISFYGVSDIGYYFTEWQIESDLKDIEKLWKHSPLAYIKNVKTPLLILHSEKDYRCPIEQGEQLFIGLKRLGKETKFIRFPEQNHELSRSGKPVLRIGRLDYISSWFNEYLHKA